MSSSVRDFVDFKSFPGNINKDTGYYELPILYYKDGASRWRKWKIFTRLIKNNDKPLTGIDWNLDEETSVSIKDKYLILGEKIKSDIIAEAWVETGIENMKITRSAPTYFDKPLNEGKSNERNVLQNSLVYARAQWLKKKEKGGNEKKSNKVVISNNEENIMYFPMLAKPFKDGEKHLLFPIYVQPKLDGIRCLIFLRKKNGGVENVVAYTRAKKIFPSVEYLKKILYKYLNALYDEEQNQSIYLDGELYKHGKKLQDISGDSRNEKADTTSVNRNEYHIYDCFYPKELSTPYSERYEQLKDLFKALSKKDAKTIKYVPTYLVNSMKKASDKYREFTEMGYEGAMLRNVDGPYLSDPNKTGTFLRSNDLVKLKPKFTDEFKVVGYTDGAKGKDKGAIIWQCETEDGVVFNVTPKDITYTERYELFNDAENNFDKKYKNKMLTVEYEDISNTGVPLRAKALIFRDYE